MPFGRLGFCVASMGLERYHIWEVKYGIVSWAVSKVNGMRPLHMPRLLSTLVSKSEMVFIGRFLLIPLFWWYLRNHKRLEAFLQVGVSSHTKSNPLVLA